MSQPYDEDDQLNEIDNEYESPIEDEPGFVKRLRNDAKQGKEAQKRLAALEAEMAKAKRDQQELAMRRAGIDLESPLAQMFARANADLVDVDTIKSEWEKVATLGQPSPEQQDAQALGRINAAQTGAAPSGAAVPDFEAELDAIPELVDGEYNPNYVQEVLKAAQVQASREGREFVTSDPGRIRFQTNGPATTPLS